MPETALESQVSASPDNWAMARGDPCPACGRDSLRFQLVGNKRVCPSCYGKAQERQGQEMDMKSLLRTLRRTHDKNRR